MAARIHGALHPALAIFAIAGALDADAQGVYPVRPIRLIVPFAPGAGTDATARLVARTLGERLSQPVVVDNRPGAGGTVGAGIAAKSAPDGYTLLIITPSHTINAALYANLPYDLRRDLAPVTQLTTQPNVMVINPAIPATSVREFIAYARERPGKVFYASSGAGGLSHLGGALFGSLAGLHLVHVAFTGGGLATIELIAGRTQMQLGSFLLNGQHIKAGRLRALAVTTPQRWPGEPDLPTMQEAGLPGFSITQWYGLLAPSGTPPVIVKKLSDESSRALNQPGVREELAAAGAQVVAGSPADFSAHIRSELDQYAKVVTLAGLKPK